MDTSSEAALRNAIVEAYRHLAEKGLNSGSSGNISCRFDDGLLITPTGADGDSLTVEKIVSLTLEGEARGPGTPSSEWGMHAGIYRRRPEAQAVVHTHADACVALSCMRRSIPSFHYMVAGFGGNDIRCAPYAPFGSLELARNAAEAMKGRTACLLANHGMLCLGQTLAQAVASTIKLETLARQYLMALQAGEPVLLSEDEMAIVRERYAYYGRSRIPQRR